MATPTSPCQSHGAGKVGNARVGARDSTNGINPAGGRIPELSIPRAQGKGRAGDSRCPRRGRTREWEQGGDTEGLCSHGLMALADGGGFPGEDESIIPPQKTCIRKRGSKAAWMRSSLAQHLS